MKDSSVVLKSESIEETEIDVRQLLCSLWKNKLLLIASVLVAAVVAAAISISLPNKYVSEATLLPAQSLSQNKLGALAGQFGGLASLAGIDMSSGSFDKTQLILETLSSRQFIVHVINKHDLKVPLFAGIGQDDRSNSWLLDDEIYDGKKKQWVRKIGKPFDAEPSEWEVYEAVMKDVLRVTHDKKTGILKISIKLRSPYAAKHWLDLFIDELNDWMREKVISEKRLTMQYLTQQIQGTNISDMQKLFYSLIEKEQTELMLAQTQREYALKVVDPGVVSPIKSEPKRSIFTILGAILGFAFGLVIIVLRSLFPTVSETLS